MKERRENKFFLAKPISNVLNSRRRQIIKFLHRFLWQERVPKRAPAAQQPCALSPLYTYKVFLALHWRTAMDSHSLCQVLLISMISVRGIHYSRPRRPSWPEKHSLLNVVLSKQSFLQGSTACSVRYQVHSRIDMKRRVALWETEKELASFLSFFS